ncbi:MAG: hypothetical protein KUG77_14675, partial [Nannocystaceae bacterium]|nr:hypothetical protein [Nannocystaceae bacterium]
MLALLGGCGDDGGAADAGTDTAGTSGGTANTTQSASNSETQSTPTPTSGNSMSAGSGQADTGTTTGNTADGTDSGGTPSTEESSTGEPIELDDFSFFLTSYEALAELSGSVDGFGGNLSYDGEIGIAGADHLCETIAEMSMPGSSAKNWRAFLSTSTEDAIDRVGSGPWYDRNGRLAATDLSELVEERPGGDPALASDIPNEWGIPNSNPDGTADLD